MQAFQSRSLKPASLAYIVPGVSGPKYLHKSVEDRGQMTDDRSKRTKADVVNFVLILEVLTCPRIIVSL